MRAPHGRRVAQPRKRPKNASRPARSCAYHLPVIYVRGTSWLLCVAFSAFGLAAAGCEEERQIEPSVDARSGLSQPGEAGGPLLDERVACERYEKALSEAKERLSCSDVGLVACPALIRPGGSLACLQYSESSVSECVSRVESYKRCSDFQFKACFVTALADTNSAACVPPKPPAASDAGSGDGGAAPDAAASAPDAGKAARVDAGKNTSGRPSADAGTADAGTSGGDTADIGTKDAGATDAG